MGFLKTILIILLVYYLFRLLARWFAPRLLQYAVKKTEKRFNEQFGGTASYPSGAERPVGEVSVDSAVTQKRKKASKDIGEYIEFEELE